MRNNIGLVMLGLIVVLVAVLAVKTLGSGIGAERIGDSLALVSTSVREILTARQLASSKRIEEGRLLKSAEQHEEALAAFQAALDISPENLAARVEAELCFVTIMAYEPDRFGNDTTRLRYLATRYQANPDGIESEVVATLALANLALFVDADQDRAEALFNQALGRDSGNVYAQAGLANVAFQRAKGAPTKGLLLSLDNAVKESAPRFVAETAARVALSEGNYESAASHAEKARTKRRTAGNLLLSARADLGLEKYPSAESYAEQVIALAPNDVAGYQLLCQAQVLGGRFAQATGSCGATFERSRDPNDQLMLARALAATHRDREAADAFVAALQRDDRQMGAYLELGELLSRLGDVRGAAWAYSRLANLAPSKPDEPLPPDVEKLRDEARKRFEALGPIPPAEDDGKGAAKGHR